MNDKFVNFLLYADIIPRVVGIVFGSAVIIYTIIKEKKQNPQKKKRRNRNG